MTTPAESDRPWLASLSPEDQKFWQSVRDDEGWRVPCEHDTGKRKRFYLDHGPCHNCLLAGHSDATPYCMGDHYARAKRAIRALKEKP